ncbi:MAG: hybrid sensor histidine kinase/response regulator [Verrucomicrobia bacterium]|nr:MAG: hybrid sensor histidine kinase/response regulator [Verrucomicrobiota bacterium]
MSLKNRILLILIAASILAAVVTGAVLIFLVQLHGQVSFEGNSSSILTVLAVAVYLLGGLLMLGLLAALLNKMVIIPTVEREMLENEREMLTEQLHHSQKMEAVGHLAGSIAHDFNNLLTIIDGYSSLIIADPASKETGQNAQEVVEAARKASFITRKLLSFSHKEQTEPVVLDLNTTLADTDKMLSRLIGEKVQLITRFSSGFIFVKADPIQLGQVLMNLAVNARDAMPNGGRITIKTALQEVGDGEHRKPDNFSTGTYAEISVRDTGQGIDPEKIGQIFEPFFTTKESGKGTGLGLSIVKTIIKQTGGFIDLISKQGGGTTFMIYLPLAELEEEMPAEAPAVEMPAQADPDVVAPAEEESAVEHATQTILLVEDDPMIRALVSQTLEMQDYKVLVADDGWEAVQLARKYDGPIDLLFTDVVMPGLGGAELALAVRELYPEINLLFMSGYSRSQVTEEGVPPDAALLEKPFTPDKVVAMVRDLLAEKVAT